MDQFVLFGDSITQQSFSQDPPPNLLPTTDKSTALDLPVGFFGPALTNAYIRKLDVVNRGLSGYNTRDALKVMPKILPSPQQARVRILTIFFGANDARLPDTPPGPQQHVPLEEFKENLRAIATHEYVRAHDGIKVILITPPPIEERVNIKSDESKNPDLAPMFRRSATTTAQYAQAVRELGTELRMPVLDIWSAMIKEAGHDGRIIDSSTLPGSKEAPESKTLQAFLHDGLHFSRLGYKLLYEELTMLIERKWPEDMPEKLPFVLPRWDDQEAWMETQMKL